MNERENTIHRQAYDTVPLKKTSHAAARRIWRESKGGRVDGADLGGKRQERQ